uniref:Calmodulin-lysine N-methyltransferase n=1 Tax=Rhizochromulina marina TaxID=1034831 RepID=A0A7S2SQV4_9STRA
MVCAQVWDAETILTHHLVEEYGMALQGCRVLELGAGTGLSGIVAARLGADVTLTEVEEAVPLLERNRTRNLDPSTVSVVLTQPWGEALHPDIAAKAPFDFILVADCIYWPHLYEPLIKTICDCSGTGSRVLISFEQRRRDVTPFFDLFTEKFGSAADWVAHGTAASQGYEVSKVKVMRGLGGETIVRGHQSPGAGQQTPPTEDATGSGAEGEGVVLVAPQHGSVEGTGPASNATSHRSQTHQSSLQGANGQEEQATTMAQPR